MPWKPLPSVAFAIATYPFRATEPHDLPLQVGDHIYVIEQGGKSNDWYRGYLVTPPSLLAGLTNSPGQQLEHRVFSGIFPRNCVEVRELLGENKVSGKTATGDASAGTQDSDAGGEDKREDRLERRKSQRAASRRLSRGLSRKRSQKEIGARPRALIDPSEPMPRDPGAPKPTAPVPLLRVGDETGQSADEPLVDEIASCLREWHDARLHAVLLARGYTQLQKVQDLIRKVDTSRKQLMHDVMTLKELNSLREDTVWDLVKGNKLLNDEVIVRSPHERGRILTAEDSVIEITKLQANMSILDRPPNPPADKHLLHHILVDIKTLVCESEVPASLQVYLCSKDGQSKPLPLTESYAIPVPLPTDPAAPPEDQPKTLFVNLSAADIGIRAPLTSLYLVFKLIKDEPVRQHPAITSYAGPAHASNGSVSMNGLPVKQGGRGRRSVFGSQRKQSMDRGQSRAHSRGASRTERPTTSQSTRSEAETQSSATNSEPPASREVKMVKRTVGIGAIDIGAFARDEGNFDKKVTLWSPAVSAEHDRSDEGDDWNEVIRELSRSATGYSRVGSVKRFEVFAKAFASSDLDGLVRVTPTFLHDVHLTQKLGFSGAPKERRSDIYLTLTAPIIPGMAHLAHAKFGNVPLTQRANTSLANLQLTLEVRRTNGERIEECIFTASNHQGHTAWRTTGIERGEGWNQTIRLEIPPEDVPGSHVVMSIADSPNFPFALAWVPLWEGDAFLRDGEHHIQLYVYDEYSSSVIGGKGAYLALPPWHKKNDPLSSAAAIISLRTYLCSTQYSQDPTLLGLLNWRALHGENLKELLERFSFVPEIEIVKLLEEVFRSLFEILHEYSNSEEHEDLLFMNFVYIFTITKDRRFDLPDVVEHYATTRHDFPETSQCLLRAYGRLLANPMDSEGSRRLRATLKVGDKLLRLIVETHKEPTAEEGVGAMVNGERYGNFKSDLQHLFVAVMALMRNPMAVLLGTQTLVVQHFHNWLPELALIMTPTEVLEVATDLMDACAHAQGKMILYRLILVVNFSNVDIFKQGPVKTQLVANTFRWLAPYWGETIEVTEQWRAQVRLCCSVVATQLVELGEECCQYVPKLVESYGALQREERLPKRTFTMLFPTTFPFPAKRTPEEVEVDEAMLEISALLAAALTTGKRLYFDASVVDIPGVLLQALKVGQSVLKCGAFPRSWMSLLVSHHRLAMSALERISEVLIDSLPDIYAPDAAEAFEFDTEIWRAFFDTLFAAVSSPALAMETFPEQKRRAIWKIAGDVREMGAHLLKTTWEAIGWETDDDAKKLHGFKRMGGYQVQFVPELIAPVVELCLSVHASLRNVAIEVLRAMIVSAWEIDQDLSVIQTAMIECLDKLCRTQPITEGVMQKAFINELLTQFQPLKHSVEDNLYNAVVDMFARIEELLSMLATVHQDIPRSASREARGQPTVNDAAKIMDTLRLMDFLKDVNSDDAYIRYVHQLADLQSSAGFHTEAGLALQLHADRYKWDSDQHVEAMAEPRFPEQRAMERKEALYFQMISHFERGYCWKGALAAYKELLHQYEFNTFDFSKLARTQRAMAAIHDKIAKGDRATPRYFRVLYRGLGFPINVRDKEFVYQGSGTERLSSFEDRLLQMYPGAQILRVGQEPSDVEGQYLQVFAVSMHRDLQHTVYQRTKVSSAVRDYYLASSPQVFTTTARAARTDVAITDQEVEKTFYTTAQPFPTIIRRSEIVKMETTTLSPLHAAVERTTRKTQELVSFEKRIQSGEEAAYGGLSEALLLSVDPHSDSSVARYRSLLPTSVVGDTASVEADLTQMPDEEIQLDPMQNALKVALLDHALAIRRCLTLYKRPAHLATKSQMIPRFEATFEHELSILFPNNNAMDEESVRSSQWDERDTEPIVQPDAAEPATAAAAQDSAAEDATPGSEQRQSRRRSLNLFKRNSTISLSGPNGTKDAKPSRQDSNRARGTSVGRRLSLFRSESRADKERAKEDKAQQQQYGISRPGSSEDLRGRAEGGTLRKRLSFLNNSGGKGGDDAYENTGGAYV